MTHNLWLINYGTIFKFFTWCIDWTCNCAGDLHTFISHETNVWRSAADISIWLRRGLEWWVRSWSVISAKNAKKYLKSFKNSVDFYLLVSIHYSMLVQRQYFEHHLNNLICVGDLSQSERVAPIWKCSFVYLFLLMIVGFRKNYNRVVVNYQIDIVVYEFLAEYES